MAITSTGIGSGLDIENIVSQLMTVESQPLTRLQTREAGIQARISSMGALRSALNDFAKAVDQLADAETFGSSRPTVSDEGVLGVTADDASPGSLSVEVFRLAENHRMASGPRASDAAIGGTDGDSLEITVGTDTLVIDLSEARTLAEIRDLINADTGGVGVSASLLTEEAGGDQRLIVNAKETGFDNRLQLAFGGNLVAGDLGFETLNIDADTGLPLADFTKLNASVSVDGFLVSRSGNRIDDLVAGLSFELNEVGTARVNIAQDDVPIVQAMTGVVDKYNALKAKLDELAAGNLSGDGLTRSITSSVRSAMNRSFAGFGDFAVLTQLGISTTEDGELEFDTGRLTEALSANRTGVAEFFSSENGFGAALSTSLNAYLDNDGIFDTRVDGLNRRVSDLQNQQERWADRLIDIEERYRRQFTALDGLVAQLLNTSNFLAQQLDNLPGFTRNSDN